MHALRHVHGLLVPRGTLVDLHPVAESTVESEGRVLGVIPEPEFVERDLPNAEAALEQAIAEGLYALEADARFVFLRHFDTAEELRTTNDVDLSAVEPLWTEIRAAAPPFVVRDDVVLRRLRALPAGRTR